MRDGAVGFDGGPGATPEVQSLLLSRLEADGRGLADLLLEELYGEGRGCGSGGKTGDLT
jgi:hypothetical protein